ncbi:MAG: hypothetical protein AUF64_05000 [Chloroflexi bacterium 13_1_20CM_54_36]|jgi:hypothetical protein|nr:MAG: hypothetical protein AUH05_02520 [Ktedonobacter sp. 13_2_20CM_53_11]OLD83318.1 MAG: hypothetical protein AUF64_05000 [Chloroflexi bacterium 13_1_20CM_54_36]
MIHGREIKVMPLHTPWAFDWAEVLTIKHTDGSTFETVLNLLQLGEKMAIVDQGDEEIHILLDKEARTWREMTEQELERDRCAWDADREQLKRECREYREG